MFAAMWSLGENHTPDNSSHRAEEGEGRERGEGEGREGERGGRGEGGREGRGGILAYLQSL